MHSFKMKAGPRSPWLDNAKMMAMLCVIAGHTGEWFGGWPLNIGSMIVAFNMPLFVLLSGYTSLGGLLRLDSLSGLIRYAEKVLWRMVVPAVCLSAVDQAWRGMLFARKLWLIFAALAMLLWLIGKMKDGRTNHLPSQVLSIVRALLVVFLLYSSLDLNMYWFLSMLMKLQMAAGVMILLGKWMNPSVKYLVTAVSVLLWGLSFFVFDSWSFEMSVYFACGLVLKQAGLFDRIFQMNRWVAIALCIIGCVLCLSFTIDFAFYTNGLSELVSNGSYHIYPLRVGVGLLISIPIIRCVYALSHDYNWFSKMGSFTLAFYTIHCLILDDFLKPYILIDNPANYMWILGILATVALTAITYIIICVCERWVVTRRLVLGDWK